MAIVEPLDAAVPSAAERAERVSDRLGLEPAKIERLPFDLSALSEEGIFLNVDARNFGMLDRRLDWKALGVQLPGDRDFSFRAGRCGLIPDRYRLPLLRPSGRAHAALHRFSYHFRLVETVFDSSSYRWIPWRAWQAFEREFAASRAQLAAALSTYTDDFPEIRERVVRTFRQLAADSARRLVATGQPVSADFEEAVVGEVLSSLPTPEVLHKRLSLEYRVGVMLLGSEMWGEQRRAADERRRLQEADAEAALERRRQESARQLVQEQLWAAQERFRQQRRTEEEEARREAAIKEQLRQLKLQAARDRLEDALSPLQEGARQLHAAIYEAATTIRASLQKHQALRGPSARKVRELCRWYGLMNWQGDAQLEALVRDLEQLATTPAAPNRKRDPNAIDQVLGDIVALTYADARELAEPNRMAALEI